MLKWKCVKKRIKSNKDLVAFDTTGIHFYMKYRQHIKVLKKNCVCDGFFIEIGVFLIKVVITHENYTSGKNR